MPPAEVRRALKKDGAQLVSNCHFSQKIATETHLFICRLSR
jgi:hypothetical protein